MLTKKQKKAAKRAWKAVNWFHERMVSLCSDPMTSAMGAPVDDFAEQWAREHRAMLVGCLDNPHNTPRVEQMLWDELEVYLP